MGRSVLVRGMMETRDGWVAVVGKVGRVTRDKRDAESETVFGGRGALASGKDPRLLCRMRRISIRAKVTDVVHSIAVLCSYVSWVVWGCAGVYAKVVGGCR